MGPRPQSASSSRVISAGKYRAAPLQKRPDPTRGKTCATAESTNSKGPQAGQLLNINNGTGAQKRTRTSTPFRVPAPEAGASTNSAIWATESDVRGWPLPVNRLFEVSVSVTEKLFRKGLKPGFVLRFWPHADPDGQGPGRGRSRREHAASAPSDRGSRRPASAPR